MGAQHKLGQLAPGMLADLIVVDRDPFAIPVTQLHDVRVVMTIVDGQLVFER
jgi:predicted amidohydrolase YtcJ